MPVEWTPHRFSGGALALDLANTVVHRERAERRFDRFDDPAEIVRFSTAARAMRADEFGPDGFRAASPATSPAQVIALREATDALFRNAARQAAEPASSALLPPLLRSAADLMEGQAPDAFETAAALSALALIEPARRTRIRICPNCSWLFLDHSRNASRRWCDMAVCGNRAKARRHYRRARAPSEAGDADA